jgi:hypothetical protein
MSAELGDPRLIVRAPVASGELSDYERHLAQFQAAARAFADSMQGEMDRERRVASWTWGDPAGRVWGVRQGLLMINGEKIMSIEVYGERDQGRAARMEARQRTEILDQAERMDRERYIQERGRAVRERRDRERSARRP